MGWQLQEELDNADPKYSTKANLEKTVGLCLMIGDLPTVKGVACTNSDPTGINGEFSASV